MILREIISSLRALLPFLGKGSIYMGTPSSLPLIQQWAAEGRGHAASSSTGAADFELNHVCQFRSQRGRGHSQDQDGQVGGVGVGGLLQRPSQGRRLEALESGPWSKSPTWQGPTWGHTGRPQRRRAPSALSSSTRVAGCGSPGSSPVLPQASATESGMIKS